MIVSKLLSIKRDNNIIIYSIVFDDEKLSEILSKFEAKLSKKETDVVDTTFAGLIPLSYGKYDNMKNICLIKEHGLHQTKKDKESKEYFASLGGQIAEWEFLSDEEKALFMPIEGTQKGKLKLEITYPSVLCKIIKETFLSKNENCIIDGTKLIKLSNQLFGFNNDFVYDKTIDLNTSKKWNDPGIAFFSKEDYNAYLNRCARKINHDRIAITEREANEISENIGEILYNLQSVLYCEQVGMFPMDLTLSKEFEILKRFGIRNEMFEWLDHKLEYAPINYDGRAIINSVSEMITSNYDLDGTNMENKIISRIENRNPDIQKIISLCMPNSSEQDETTTYDNIHELTKKIKAA